MKTTVGWLKDQLKKIEEVQWLKTHPAQKAVGEKRDHLLPVRFMFGRPLITRSSRSPIIKGIPSAGAVPAQLD